MGVVAAREPGGREEIVEVAGIAATTQLQHCAAGFLLLVHTRVYRAERAKVRATTTTRSSRHPREAKKGDAVIAL